MYSTIRLNHKVNFQLNLCTHTPRKLTKRLLHIIDNKTVITPPKCNILAPGCFICF